MRLGLAAGADIDVALVEAQERELQHGRKVEVEIVKMDRGDWP